MATILVTGINGFVGGHLAKELHGQGWNVVGIGQESAPASGVKNFLTDYASCDLTDYAAVAKLPLDDVKAIINLAGLAAVGRSFDQPDLYMKVNVDVLATLCRRVQELDRKDLRIIAISSGALYASGQPLPLTENSLTDGTTSPYAASKLAMEETARQYAADGFDCVIARPFNHIGPRQAEGFLLPDLYAKITSAKGSEIKVGNLETRRDYTDVRDVARAYAALATKDVLKHAIYNVCSGHAVSGSTILSKLKDVCKRPDLQTKVDASLFRPSDAPIIYGDNSRLRAETGWQPSIPLEQTIQDFVKTA